MEEGYELDLTYVTERIIAVSFPRGCSEATYLHNLQDVTRMLKSKHADNYLVINLSEKRDDLNKMNPKTMDTGWPDLHAPPLDKICTICKAMESWLNADPQHVAVIHCRGGKGRIGVIISSYVHFTSISASADQALDRFAMKKFFDDKVSALMTPSQKRYVWILSSLLTGSMKMNTSLLFLHQVILHAVPNFDTGGVCQPYLKVYQGMQLVYTSGIYHINPGYKGRIYVALEPAQLVKGDIMIKCYHRNPHNTSGREVIFQVQFHTGMVHGASLVFEKEALEQAQSDTRFPDYGKVELLFSESPEKIQGSERWQNGPEVAMDYNTSDPVVRWDSYENFTAEGDVTVRHVPGLVDGSLYAKVRKKSLDSAPKTGATASSPENSDPALSASSDSGLSSTSVRVRRGPTKHEKAELKRLLSGFGLEPPGEAMERQTVGIRYVVPAQVHVNGENGSGERETDILDDEVPSHDLHSVDSIGTLSSSEGQHSNLLGMGGYHKSSQNSLLSDGFGSHAGEEHHTPVVPDMGLSPEDYERNFGDSKLGSPQRPPTTPKTQAYSQSGYSTHTWVWQQQMVTAQQYSYPPAVGDIRFPQEKRAPETPTRGNSSREVTQRAGAANLNGTDSKTAREDDLASLTVDIDQSIDQLNQLIMDLDPTFVPIPTRSTSIKSIHCNGSTSPNSHQTEAESDPTQQANDTMDGPALESAGWGLAAKFINTPNYSPEPQLSALYRTDSVQFSGRNTELDNRVDACAEMVPPTPAFPVSPPTPYVKSISEFSQTTPPSFEMHRTVNGYLESMNHSAVSTDGDLFRSEMGITTTTSTGPFGSMGLPSNSSSPQRTGSPAAQSWQDLNLKPTLGRYGPLNSPGRGGSMSQHSPPLSHPAPNCHSSPRGTPRPQGYSEAELSTLLDDGGGSLERSLLAAMEGLGHVGATVQPPLPEKRRVSEGEHSLGSASPALSGFSSPHSGSTISIPFPSVLPDFSSRGLPPSSPLPETYGSKQMTVKFVQDTSKFWYKPDISRDQAIAVLKDKVPGSFIVRDSHSFRGAYGLAMKVATPPPSVLQQSKKAGGDLSNELVRHFLIECTPKGVRLKGCPNEPYFGSLTALVCQHSITPLALPCKLIIPDRDPLEDMAESPAQTATNSAAELLKQGAACNVWYLGSVEMESLTGYQAVQKAASVTLSMDPPPTSTVVHFKVSAQGITLTDNQRKLFFRRHYTVNTVIFCALDPQDRKWTKDGCSSARIFGFVARKTSNGTDNVCHLFAEHDPEQPASAIVNFVSKVMIGSLKNK